MNTLLADAREVPARYWGLGALLLVALYVTSSADVPQLLPSQLMFAPYPRLIWSIATLAVSAGPLIAVVRPWWALVLAGLCVLTAAFGVLLFTALAGLAAVSFVAWWRSRTAPWVAAAVAGVASTWLILGHGEQVYPGNATGFGTSLTWYWDTPAQAIGYAAAYVVALLLVAGLGWLFRRSAARSVSGRVAIARAGEVEQQSEVVAERARLARDLHDVVAHHVSLIAVRAETAPYTHPGLDADARVVLGEIAGDARLALDELRGVLGILSRSADGSVAERAPQPGLSDLPDLVERSRSAGVAVQSSGDPTVAVTPAVGYVAYRVVQEALTNARRHAPGAAVDLTLDASAGMLVVAVANPVAEGAAPGPGRGLAGMRERVEAVGGHLEAGEQGGWFVIRATLPRGER